MNDAKEAQDVLLGVYRSTVEDAMYSYHLSIYFSMGTDISQVEGSTTENFHILPTNAYPLLQGRSTKHMGCSLPVSIMPMIFGTIFLSKWNHIMKRTNSWRLFTLPEARALKSIILLQVGSPLGNIPLMTNTAMSQPTSVDLCANRPSRCL